MSTSQPAVAQTSGWPQEVTSANVSDSISAPDGSVTALGCSSPQGTSQAQTYTPQGVADGPPIVNSDMWFCGERTAVDAAGTLYGVFYDNAYPKKQYIVAYQHGVELWRKNLTASVNGSTIQLEIENLVVGADSHLYALSVQVTGSSNKYLSKLRLSDGHLVLQNKAGNQSYTFFSPINTGLVSYYQYSTVRYLSFNGQIAADVPVQESGGESSRSIMAADYNGKAIVALNDYRHENETCDDSSSYSYTSKLVSYDSSGKLWHYSVDDCSYINSAVISSDGTTVFTATSDIGEKWMGSLNGSGALVKRVELPYEKDEDHRYYDSGYVIADTNGNVLHRRSYYRYWSDPWFNEFNLLEPATLQPKASYSTQSLHGYAGATAVSLAPGALYFTSQKCMDECQDFLHKIPFAELGMDYPRGAALGVQSQDVTLQVVFPGDSFTSAEGVPKFMAPSDVNGCHRSEHAYAKVLANDPELGFNLQAFPACSGARTWELETGRNGEPSQLDSITPDTDVVILTIGGNDIGFGRFVRECLDPGWPLGTGTGTCDQNSVAYSDIMNNISMMSTGLTNAYSAIQAKIGNKELKPNVKVLVVGYPFVVRQDITSCDWTLLNSDEQAAIEEVTMSLGAKISDTVISLGDTRFRYVDALIQGGPFTNHDMCNEWDSYFNPWPQDEEVFVAHPNAKGHVAYARLIKEFWLAIN